MVGFSHAMVTVSPGIPSKLRTPTSKNQEAAKNFDYFINAVVNGQEDIN